MFANISLMMLLTCNKELLHMCTLYTQLTVKQFKPPPNFPLSILCHKYMLNTVNTMTNAM